MNSNFVSFSAGKIEKWKWKSDFVFLLRKEKRKTKMNLNFIFLRNWKSVGTKVHGFWWFEFWLDYHVKTLQKHPNLSENEMNNSLAAKLHQVERGLSTKHATKWRSPCGEVCFWFGSLLFTTSISMTRNLKLEKTSCRKESYNTRDKFA